MRKFAEGTLVPVEKSRATIEKILRDQGADQVSVGWSANKVMILFRMHARIIRIELPLPELYTNKTAQEKETRRRWRALLLYLKAKLESIESEIVSFEQAFMSHMILPNQQTVSEFMKPQIDDAYSTGNMPKQIGGW